MIPAILPIEERESERWCHASAIRAAELTFFAAPLVYQYIASLTSMERTAAARASSPGASRDMLSCPMILRNPASPMAKPVMQRIIDSRIAATHSIRSCPYWWFSSDSFPARRYPTITTTVLKTSDAECIPSETIAPECARKPASTLNMESAMFAAIL